MWISIHEIFFTRENIQMQYAVEDKTCVHPDAFSSSFISFSRIPIRSLRDVYKEIHCSFPEDELALLIV